MSKPPVILDIGTVNTRAGRGGQTVPECVFPTLVGEVNKQLATPMIGQGEMKSHFVGKAALDKRSLLKIRQPVNGVPNDYNACEMVVQHAMEELGEGCKRLCLIEPTQATMEIRENLVEFAIETLKCEEFWLLSSIPCSLFASGRTTGIVLEASESASHVVPVLEGHALSRSKWTTSELSGLAVTSYMVNLLKRNGRLDRDLPPHINRMIKEKFSYTSTNMVDDNHTAETSPDSLVRVYELPDGGSLELCDERFRCSEYFFHPSSWTGTDKIQAIHKSVVKTITDCDEKLQTKLFHNIVACGGVSLGVGFQSRLQKDINSWLNGSGEGNKWKSRLKLSSTVKLVDTTLPPSQLDPTICTQAWRGASILSQLPSFNSMKITATDVREGGNGVVHRNAMVPPKKMDVYF